MITMLSLLLLFIQINQSHIKKCVLKIENSNIVCIFEKFLNLNNHILDETNYIVELPLLIIRSLPIEINNFNLDIFFRSNLIDSIIKFVL